MWVNLLFLDKRKREKFQDESGLFSSSSPPNWNQTYVQVNGVKPQVGSLWASDKEGLCFQSHNSVKSGWFALVVQAREFHWSSSHWIHLKSFIFSPLRIQKYKVIKKPPLGKFRTKLCNSDQLASTPKVETSLCHWYSVLGFWQKSKSLPPKFGFNESPMTWAASSVWRYPKWIQRHSLNIGACFFYFKTVRM